MSELNNDPWQVFNYEIQMYFETRIRLKHLKTDGRDSRVMVIKNALTESLVLHTRIMVDILISKGSGNDDITLKDLLPDWPQSEIGRQMIGELKSAYGKSDIQNSPCWVFNKMLAHPTRWRADSYNYFPALKQIEHHVLSILREIEKIRSMSILQYYLAQYW